MARVAAADSPVLDHVMPRLGRVADHGVLWIAIALGLGATGHPRARRAALRGLASLIIASSTANVVAKGLTGRARPDAGIRVPRRRAIPATSSFPSGHSASAAAFATGAGLELPWLAAPLGVLAAAVGSSRVVIGVHYPSDVLAGLTIGVTAGTLTLRLAPRRPRLRPWRLSARECRVHTPADGPRQPLLWPMSALPSPACSKYSLISSCCRSLSSSQCALSSASPISPASR